MIEVAIDPTADDRTVRWTATRPLQAAGRWPGVDRLLDDFGALGAAQPEEMAAFVGAHGIPELCGYHGMPEGHLFGPVCPLGVDGEHRGIAVRHLRQAARSYAAARELGRDLHLRRVGRDAAWDELPKFLPGPGKNSPYLTDLRSRRQSLAS